MKDKFVLNFKQVPAKEGPASGLKSPSSRTTGGKQEPRKHTYLHDHRARDSLVEYLDDLESD